MNALGRAMPKIGTKLVKAAATGIGATVVDTTPVDTGLARSNWQASLDSPLPQRPPYSAGSGLGIGETANASAAKGQQRQVIGVFDARKHQRLVISNFVPYIGALNNGSPTTRAHAMVQQGLQTGRAVLQAIKVLDSKGIL
jgi:hypothetical protein